MSSDDDDFGACKFAEDQIFRGATTSRGWPVFTSPIAKQAADAFDHRALREDRIDELVARALNEDRI